jgi:PAS domain S-box-containing protein
MEHERQQLDTQVDGLPGGTDKLLLLADSIPALVCYVDAAQRYTFVNRAYEEWFKCDRRDLIGMHVRDALGAPTYERLREHVEASLSGRRVDFEGFLSYPDGQVRYVEATYVPDRGADGAVNGFVALVRDVTDRKLTQDALVKSEARVRRLIDSDLIGIAITSLDGAVHEANDAFLQILGLTREDLLDGRANWIEMTAPEDVAESRRAAEQARRAGKCAPFEKEYVRPDGTRVPALVGASLLEGSDRECIVFVLDMTEHRRIREALVESEQRFRQLAENIQSVFWLVSPDLSQPLYVSPAYEKIWGRPCQDLYENPGAWLEAVHPDDRELVGSAQGQLASGRYDVEFRIVRPDGATAWIHERAFPIRDAAGSIYRVAGIATDITERKRAVAELAESANRYQAAVHATNQALFDWNVATNVVTWGGNCKGTLGYSCEELAEMGFGGLVENIHPEDRETFDREIQRVLRTKEPFHLTYRARRKDGTYIVVQDDGRFFSDASGNVRRMVGFVADITEHKRAEEALEARVRQQAAVADLGRRGLAGASLPELFDAAVAAVARNLQVDFGGLFELLPDGDGFVLQAGFGWRDGSAGLRLPAGLASQAGYTLLAGEPVISEDFESETRFRPSDLLREHGARSGLSVLVRGKERSFGVLEAFATARRSFSTDDTHFLETVANVLAEAIDRDRAEEALVRTEQQLHRAQRMEAVGRLAGGVAHDFNNLLTVISGYTEFLEKSLSKDDPLQGDVREIRSAGERAVELTRQLLAFSRKQMLQPKVFALNETVANLAKMLQRLIGEDIELVLRLDEGRARVKADPAQVEQVIVNLAVNARDAMPDGGRLTISTADAAVDEAYARAHPDVAPGEYVALAVSDTGHGMDEETLAQIFEPFFTTKGLGKGTGLGLSTVYGIVQQSGGAVEVESAPGRGSTFRVYLPRVEQKADSLVGRPAAADAPAGSETVLVAEDEAEVRKLAVVALKRSGYKVLEASNAGEALLLCEQHSGPIDLLVTDVVMPRMSGRQLAERLAQIRPDMSVLYMSGYTDDAIVHHGVLNEGIEFIHKPFTPDALARKVRAVLDARGGAPGR